MTNLIAKIHTRSVSILCALILVCSGVYMCIADIKTTGSINIKAIFIEGQIESGSLGLMAMFLGVIIIVAVNLHRPYKNQEIKLSINDDDIEGKGLSFRKIKEIINASATKNSSN